MRSCTFASPRIPGRSSSKPPAKRLLTRSTALVVVVLPHITGPRHRRERPRPFLLTRALDAPIGIPVATPVGVLRCLRPCLRRCSGISCNSSYRLRLPTRACQQAATLRARAGPITHSLATVLAVYLLAMSSNMRGRWRPPSTRRRLTASVFAALASGHCSMPCQVIPE